jgi:hypothetical protein
MLRIIYGAQNFAMSYYAALKQNNESVFCFAVSDTEDNPETIDNIPVVKLENLLEYKNSATVFVAVSPALQKEIIEVLEKNGFSNIVPMANKILNEILLNYHRAKNDISILPLQNKTTEESDIEILRVVSPADKPLQDTCKPPTYVKTFFNDSPRSKNYCELMASHNLWKNSSAKIKGIYHYRRILTDISFEPNIDAILHFPFVYYPNIDIQRKRFVSDEDWNAALAVIREIYPQCLKPLQQIFSGRTLYCFNILVAKSNVFDNYCEWLFSILEAVESIRGSETVRQDRYLGYIGECLTNFYFQYNKNKFKIFHTGLEWLV